MRRSEAPPVQMSIEPSRSGKGILLEFHRPVTCIEVPYEDAEQIARALLATVEARKLWVAGASLRKKAEATL